MTQEIIIILIGLGQGLIIVLVGAVVKGVFSIKAELAKLNGRVGRVEEWTEGHGKLDDERYETNVRHLEQLREQIRRK